MHLHSFCSIWDRGWEEYGLRQRGEVRGGGEGRGEVRGGGEGRGDELQVARCVFAIDIEYVNENLRRSALT